jgi:hypothetical protein
MVLALADGHLVLTGPCAPAPWFVEVAQGAEPRSVAADMTRLTVGGPVVVHSTSWRQARGSVVLTFVAVMEQAAIGVMAAPPVRRVFGYHLVVDVKRQ